MNMLKRKKIYKKKKPKQRFQQGKDANKTPK